MTCGLPSSIPNEPTSTESLADPILSSPSAAPNPNISLRVAPSTSHPMITRSKANTSKPKTFTDGTMQYSLPHALLAESDCSLTEPTCYTSAMKHPK